MSRTVRIALAAMAGVLLAAATAPADHGWRYALDAATSQVSARVAFMGLASRTARFPAVSGSVALQPGRDDAMEIDVVLDARALRADDAVTLSRLKGPAFFDVERHPTIRFTGHAMRRTGERTAEVAGELTARGVSRPQVLAVTFERPIGQANGREAMGLAGRMTIDRRQYGMIAYSPIVGNRVDVEIRTRMVPE